MGTYWNMFGLPAVDILKVTHKRQHAAMRPVRHRYQLAVVILCSGVT